MPVYLYNRPDYSKANNHYYYYLIYYLHYYLYYYLESNSRTKESSHWINFYHEHLYHKKEIFYFFYNLIKLKMLLTDFTKLNFNFKNLILQQLILNFLVSVISIHYLNFSLVGNILLLYNINLVNLTMQ